MRTFLLYPAIILPYQLLRRRVDDLQIPCLVPFLGFASSSVVVEIPAGRPCLHFSFHLRGHTAVLLLKKVFKYKKMA